MVRTLPSQAHADYQVMTKECAPSVFDIVALSQQPDNKHSGGTTWRAICVAVSDDSKDGKNEDGKPIHAVGVGEKFLFLFAGNVVRDDTFRDYQRAIGDDGVIGPCALLSRRVGQAQRESWEIIDGTEALAKWEASRKAAPKE